MKKGIMQSNSCKNSPTLKLNVRLVFNLVPRTEFYKVTCRLGSGIGNRAFNSIVHVQTFGNLHFPLVVYLATLSVAQTKLTDCMEQNPS